MTYRKFYLYSIIGIIMASAYPIYMSIVTLAGYLQNGSVNAADYQKYIIPYAPICIALIISAALMPLIFKLFRQFTLPAVSLIGTVLFFISEFGLEQLKIIEGSAEMPLQSWQLGLCVATPEVLRSIGKPIYAADNPAFKVHFYVIAVVIILAVLNVIYGFSKIFRDKSFSKKPPLIAQAVCVAVFIALCILACFTAFYRNGTLNISPLSAVLMSVFFTVFGITVGVYFGSIFYGRSNLLSKILPAVTASLTTIIMYIGELVLMGGVLFKYGSGFLFEPFGIVPFAVIDLIIILFSGIITYTIMSFLNSNQKTIE